MYSKNTNQSVVLHVMNSSYYTPLVLVQLFAIKVYQHLLHRSAEDPGLLIHSHTTTTHLMCVLAPAATPQHAVVKPRV